MNLHITTFAVLVASSVAHIVPSHEPLPKYSAELYSKSAEFPQAGLELQHGGGYVDQSQAYAGDAGHASKDGGARILSQHAESDEHGYHYSYETDNGIKAQEQGKHEDKSKTVQGGYSYTGDDGKTYTVTYTADEHGFRPSGEHLPTAPPMPDEIAKGLEQNEREEAAGNYDDGSYKEPHQHPDESDAYQPEYETYQHYNAEQAHHQLPIDYESHSAEYQVPVDQHGQLPAYLSHTATEFGHQSHNPSNYGQESHSTSDLAHGPVYQAHTIGYHTQGHDSGIHSQGISEHGHGSYQRQGTDQYGHETGLGHRAVRMSSNVRGRYHYRH